MLSSKQSPMMLVCRMKKSVDGPMPPSPSPCEPELIERYLVKVGDDLRQDQLMLEFFGCVRLSC